MKSLLLAFIVSIITGTISGEVQVWFIPRWSLNYKLIFQLLSNVLLFAAADKIAKLLIILLAKGPLLLHEVFIVQIFSKGHLQSYMALDRLLWMFFEGFLSRFSSFCSLTHLEHPTLWVPQLWSGSKAPAFITRGKRFQQLLASDNLSLKLFWHCKFFWCFRVHLVLNMTTLNTPSMRGVIKLTMMEAS